MLAISYQSHSDIHFLHLGQALELQIVMIFLVSDEGEHHYFIPRLTKLWVVRVHFYVGSDERGFLAGVHLVNNLIYLLTPL